jgi:hypothetical protein
MFGKEKLEIVFKRLDSLEAELKQIRNTVQNEIKIIERAGKPISNEITQTIDGEFYNNPLRDTIQEINCYFDTVISKEKLIEMIIKIIRKYELEQGSFKNYISYLERSGLINGMMDCGADGFFPIYSIVQDKTIPVVKKNDRGIFDELNIC